MDKLLEEAEKANEVLRFVGAVDVKSGKAGGSQRISVALLIQTWRLRWSWPAIPKTILLLAPNLPTTSVPSPPSAWGTEVEGKELETRFQHRGLPKLVSFLCFCRKKHLFAGGTLPDLWWFKAQLQKTRKFLKSSVIWSRPWSRSSCYSSRCIWQHHGGAMLTVTQKFRLGTTSGDERDALIASRPDHPWKVAVPGCLTRATSWELRHCLQTSSCKLAAAVSRSA